jgi:hypothetical protein
VGTESKTVTGLTSISITVEEEEEQLMFMEHQELAQQLVLL